MLRQDFIFCKIKELSSEFISPIAACADRPRKKFLRQAISAILFSGSLVVTELARWIRDDCTDIFHRIKRLLNHLVSPAVNLASLVETYRSATAVCISLSQDTGAWKFTLICTRSGFFLWRWMFSAYKTQR